MNCRHISTVKLKEFKYSSLTLAPFCIRDSLILSTYNQSPWKFPSDKGTFMNIWYKSKSWLILEPEVKHVYQLFLLKNGILLPELFWPTLRKNVLVIEKNFWNSRLKAENLQNFWDHWNNLFRQWKVRTIFGNRMLF